MNGYLRGLVGLCLLRLVCGMALPEGDEKRYADLGAGLMTMLWMLRALLSLLKGLP